MALSLSTLRKPVNNQVVDPSTGVMREEWALYFQQLTGHINNAVSELGTDPAPGDGEYLVGAANAALTAERVVTDTDSITWDLTTPGQVQAQRAAFTGDVTASANGNALTIANDAVTYAKMQNISATSRILGRKTSGAGDPEELTLSEALDFIGSAAQGDILYRGASSWARLAAGSNGQFLQTQGAGANPQWAIAGGLTLLTSGSVSSAAQLDIVLTSYTAYRSLLFKLYDFLPATDDVIFQALLSTNGGSSFISSGYGYAALEVQSDAATTDHNQSQSASQINICDEVANNANYGVSIDFQIARQAGTTRPRVWWDGVQWDIDDDIRRLWGAGGVTTAQDIDAIRFKFSSGNIASGTYAVYGYA